MKLSIIVPCYNCKKTIGRLLQSILDNKLNKEDYQVIICDEIGTKEDVMAIEMATLSGTKGIFTMHCSSIQELLQNQNLKTILEKKLIQRVIILDSKNKGKIKEVLKI